MKIEKTINKLPGGIVVIPLVIGALLNTFFPNLDEMFGGVTGGFLNGTSAILFIFFFAVGTSLNIKGAGGYVTRKGIVLSGSHLLLAALIGFIGGKLLAPAGIQSGIFKGISTLALVTAFSQTNGGLYISVLSPYKREADLGAFPFIAIQSGPFFTMIIMGATAGVSFPLASLLSTLIPFALGIFLGNLDPDIRAKFAPGVGILLPFFMLALGYSLDFRTILGSGLAGIIVGLAVVFINGVVVSFLDRKINGSDGVAGWAQASTAGAAASVPPVVAAASAGAISPEVAASATAIVATSILVTSILVPLVTNYMERRAREKGLPIVPDSVK